jgi:glucose-1-phosphate adenylyltransferase
MKNVVALVLGGGRGSRLIPLTQYRSKPAVPFGGKYRLIDVPLSNCINSQVNQVYVLTQFLSTSLHRHIRRTYRFDHYHGGFVEILAAQQTMESGTDWYEGTADAVRKNLRYVCQPWIDYVLILSGDQLYRMDFADMIRKHRESGADVTIAAKPFGRDAVSQLGVMRIDESGRVVGFLEKPQTDDDLAMVRMAPTWIDAHGVESRGREFLASMGIYLFNRKTLVDSLEKTPYQDFGREVFPASIRSRQVQVYLFDGYWEDIGTIRSFYQANIDLARSERPFELASEISPIYSRPRFLPPTRVADAAIRQSLIADGCVIGSGVTIENSVIGLRCRIGRDVTIRNSVLIGDDFYETPEQLDQCRRGGVPRLGIGDGTTIEGVIVDKNCRIGAGVKIANREGNDQQRLCDSCQIRDGIVVVEKGATICDGWSSDTGN